MSDNFLLAVLNFEGHLEIIVSILLGTFIMIASLRFKVIEFQFQALGFVMVFKGELRDSHFNSKSEMKPAHSAHFLDLFFRRK